MFRIVSILMLCLGSCFVADAQVEVKEDFPIDMLMSRYANQNQAKQSIGGWRIQIMAKTDRLAIEREKENFLLEFPGVSVDWTHSKPYYRLRAGAFQTKLQAIRMLQDIKDKYPGAFPVKDSIQKEELLSSI